MKAETSGKKIQDTIKRIATPDDNGMTAEEVHICRCVLSIVLKHLVEAVEMEPSIIIKTLKKKDVEGFILYNLLKAFRETSVEVTVIKATNLGQA